MKRNEDITKANKKNKKIWGTIFLLLILAVFLIIAPYVYDAVKNDPNIILKRVSKDLTEDSDVKVAYTQKSGKSGLLSRNRIPLYSFTPEESGDYTFSVSDIVSEDGIFLSLQVADSHFNNYLSTDNMNDLSDSFSDTVFLNEGNICYVLIEAFSVNDMDKCSGSFSLRVSRASDDVIPAEVTETDNSVVTIREDSQTAVLFVPSDSGFFRFESRVISGDRSASSDISSVRTTDNTEISRSEGICWLEGGREYYVWVSAQELSKPSVKAEVSCKRIDSFSTDQYGEYRITDDTIIEYASEETENLAVYSVSDGDAECHVYDSMGFPLNYDDDSGGGLSENDKDFALVIQAQKKSKYYIYAGGEFKECSIVITGYEGDGTSVGKNDVTGGSPESLSPEE